MSVDEQVAAGPRDGFDRTPPQDIAAEQSVLGGMLLSKDAIADVVEELRGNDFYRPAHELVYEAIIDLYGRGEPADPVTVSAELAKRGELTRIGGAPYLHTLISSVPTAANAGYYARIVREQAVLRRLVEAGTRIVQLGYATDGGDVDDLVNSAQAEVYAVTERRTSEDYVPLRDTINLTMEEIENAANRGEGMSGVPTGFADLDLLTNGLHGGQMIIVAARPAMGKALALDTPLPTPTGWTTMGEVEVGDELLAADGTPTRVVAATEVMTSRPCYRVSFDDGTSVVADAEHLWVTAAAPARAAVRVGGGAGDVPELGPTETRTTEAIARTVHGSVADGRLDHYVATAAPLDLPEAELPTEPYLLGVWLAEGHGRPAERRIPAAYLRASVRQRRELLAGLLDIAGTVAEGGAVEFASTSRRLTLDYQELAHTLGYRTTWATTHGDSGLLHVVTLQTADTVFYVERKRREHERRAADAGHVPGARRITAVERVTTVPVRCVQVDNPSHLYLAGSSMVPTHNSTLALDVCRSASIKNGLTSVIFSLEMGRTEITMRLLSAEAQVSLQHMRKGTMREEDWTRVAAAMSRVSDAPLFIDDSPNMSLMEIRAKCRRLKQRHDLRLVVVDYLQLMSSGKRVESRQQEVSEFSRALKLLAKELEVPVIAVAQLNRGPEMRQDKKPMMSDLRESGSLEQDADVVMLLHREDAYEKESPRAGEADIIVAKHRNGPTDTITVAFQGHYSRFVDMAR